MAPVTLALRLRTSTLRRTVKTGLVVAALAIGFGVVAAALPPVAAAGSGVRAAAAPAGHRQPAIDGVDPAETAAANNDLVYHERRKFPYGLTVGAVVLTALTLIAARPRRATGRADAT